MTDDTVLISRVADGDRDALTTLFERHKDSVFGVCLRVLGDREAALDVTQDVFITVFRKAGQFGGRSKLSTWLYRIAVNASYDHIRKESRHRHHELTDRHDAPDPSGADAYESIELGGQLADALAGIPEEFRSALVLADAHGLSILEVAEILKVPPGTVKSRLYRGRRAMAQILGNLSGSPEHPKDDADV